MQLRDYQKEMLDKLHRAWERNPSVMLQMPAGTGKTVLLAEEIKNCLTPSPSPKGEGSNVGGGSICKGVLVVAHRRELIEQISQTLTRFGICHGLIVSGKSIDETKPVQVASIQTLNRHMDEICRTFGLIIIDEAHHVLAKTYRKLWQRWPQARFLGLTATPCRLNKAPFTDLFDELLQSWGIYAFIEQGWLSDFEYVSVRPESIEMQQVRSLEKRGTDGDYQTSEMALVMDVPESIAHLYSSYDLYARGKKGIVYAIDRTHARHISEYYSEHGVSSCWIEAKTPAAERQRLVQAYRDGQIDVIVNVDIFSEGFDCPEVEFIQLARPTLSLSKYLQQVGRGMRVSAGKDCVLILDQVGLYQTFGLPTDDRSWDMTFRGVESGKADRIGSQPIIIREEPREKTLVNLDMVHIKRRNERREGLEIFMQDGRYGILRDGKVTCQAKFEHISRLNGKYYALGIFPFISHKNRTTVIDNSGLDMRVTLYGKIEQDGDIFMGRTLSGEVLYWDAKGNRYYSRKPKIERIGRLEVVRVGNYYQLRHQSLETNFLFSKSDVFYNEHITIIKNMLIVKNEVEHPYKVLGYDYNSILVDETSVLGYTVVMPDGSVYLRHVRPKETGLKPNLHNLHLNCAV